MLPPAARSCGRTTETSGLPPASILAVSLRLIIDKNLAGPPTYVDLTTTLRLRNASSE